MGNISLIFMRECSGRMLIRARLFGDARQARSLVARIAYDLASLGRPSAIPARSVIASTCRCGPKAGFSGLRRAQWMPVLGAVRRNEWLRPFYERLRAAGKPAKLALIAAMRKLLCAIYSVAGNRKPFTIATEQAREA